MACQFLTIFRATILNHWLRPLFSLLYVMDDDMIDISPLLCARLDKIHKLVDLPSCYQFEKAHKNANE